MRAVARGLAADGRRYRRIVEHRLMATSTQPQIPEGSIPKVICPQCGAQMTLSRIEPEGPDDSHMVFDCLCGFEYRMPDRG
jgi:RNase P subunit RPR2